MGKTKLQRNLQNFFDQVGEIAVIYKAGKRKL